LSLGQHVITAQYTGDDMFLGSFDRLTLSVI
jgi:hypothetical protein